MRFGRNIDEQIGGLESKESVASWSPAGVSNVSAKWLPLLGPGASTVAMGSMSFWAFARRTSKEAASNDVFHIDFE